MKGLLFRFGFVNMDEMTSRDTSIINRTYRQPSISKLVISMKSKYAKVIKQEQSYGVYELLSELGGSWGLFLGASLGTFAQGIDMMITRILEGRRVQTALQLQPDT
jgi:hypothetical protein